MGVGGVLMRLFSIVPGWGCVWWECPISGTVPSVGAGCSEMFAMQAWGMLPGAPYRCSLAPACGPRLLAFVLAMTETVLEIISAGWARPRHPPAEAGSQDTSPGGLKGWQLVACCICLMKSAEARRSTSSCSPTGGLAHTSAAAGHGARLVAMAVPGALSPAVT